MGEKSLYDSAPRQKLKIWLVTFLALIRGVCMQNFNPLALKLREQIKDEGRSDCKNAKFQTDLYGTKILLMIFALLKRDNLSFILPDL